MVQVFLSIGSNLGNRLHNLQQSVMMLAEKSDVKRISSVYQTRPWGYEDDNEYLNAALEISTDMPVAQLLDFTQSIERRLGRSRTSEKQQYQSRTIDIDILFYNDEVISSDVVEIPHPRLHKRNFVLVPLKEIAPGFIHPVLKKTVSQLLEESPDSDPLLKTKYGI